MIAHVANMYVQFSLALNDMIEAAIHMIEDIKGERNKVGNLVYYQAGDARSDVRFDRASRLCSMPQMICVRSAPTRKSGDYRRFSDHPYQCAVRKD